MEIYKFGKANAYASVTWKLACIRCSFGFFLEFSNLYLFYASGTLEISMPIYEKVQGGDKKEKKN